MIRNTVNELFKGKIEQLKDQLYESKISFADSHLDEADWHNKTDKRVECKVIQAQIDILQSMDYLINDAFDTVENKNPAKLTA